MLQPFVLYFARGVFCLTILFISFSCIAQDKTAGREDRTNIRTVPDSITQRMKKEKDFLYANDPSYWQMPKPEEKGAFVNFLESIGRSPLFKWSLYLFLAVIILIAIYQVMVVNDFFIFSRSGKKKSQSKISEEEYSAENIDGIIQQAINNHDYRSAIRFMYLKTLQQLHERQLIRFHANATNLDYINQMHRQKEGGQFKLLTHIYEYVWYGEFQPTEQQFERIKTNFNLIIPNN